MRYAMYFTPAPETLLWQLGSSALGYDAVTQQDVALPDHALYRDPAFLRTLETPRRYGFHATLKAPFVLRAGASEHDLVERAAAFGARCAPLLVPALEVALLGNFVALCPIAKDAELDRLAAACVRDFDDLRAPLTEAERARRLLAPLTPQQIAHLDQWGYPYVFEDFRFHMTLTGPIAESTREAVVTDLRALLYPATGPLRIDAISVLVQPTLQSRFAVLARLPLHAHAPAIALSP